MADDLQITVENLGKKFCKNLKRSMYYGMTDIARNAMGFSFDRSRLRKGEFWAFRNLSFGLKKGECLGLIGQNGAGKSTLLKMLNGIYGPDEGRIRIRGRVGALIEVGAGFHPLLTGRQNIFLYGNVLGMRNAEIMRKFDRIVEFSGVESFLDVPVKFYSSGMYVRLGFAVASHLDPDVLLVDEAMAVGDVAFRAKCFRKIGELVDKGTSIVFVSHELNLVEQACGRVLLLMPDGYLGPTSPAEAIDRYRSISFAQNKAMDCHDHPHIQVTGVDIRIQKKGLDAARHSLELEAHFKCDRTISGHPSFAVHQMGGEQIAVCRTDYDGTGPMSFKGPGGSFRLKIENAPFCPGKYLVSVRIYELNHFGVMVNHQMAYSFQLEGGQPVHAIINLEHSWEW